MINNEIIYQYFDAWNKHNISLLKNLFSEKVTLIDWENKYSGIKSVLIANEKIFLNEPTINAKIIKIFENNNEFATEIEVYVQNKKILQVIDVITIEKKLIVSIKAYKKN